MVGFLHRSTSYPFNGRPPSRLKGSGILFSWPFFFLALLYAFSRSHGGLHTLGHLTCTPSRRLCMMGASHRLTWLYPGEFFIISYCCWTSHVVVCSFIPLLSREIDLQSEKEQVLLSPSLVRACQWSLEAPVVFHSGAPYIHLFWFFLSSWLMRQHFLTFVDRPLL